MRQPRQKDVHPRCIVAHVQSCQQVHGCRLMPCPTLCSHTGSIISRTLQRLTCKERVNPPRSHQQLWHSCPATLSPTYWRRSPTSSRPTSSRPGPIRVMASSCCAQSARSWARSQGRLSTRARSRVAAGCPAVQGRGWRPAARRTGEGGQPGEGREVEASHSPRHDLRR